jgi:hypothetical protein
VCVSTLKVPDAVCCRGLETSTANTGEGSGVIPEPFPRGVRVTPVEDLTRNDLNQVLAKIADREPDFRLAT